MSRSWRRGRQPIPRSPEGRRSALASAHAPIDLPAPGGHRADPRPDHRRRVRAAGSPGRLFRVDDRRYRPPGRRRWMTVYYQFGSKLGLLKPCSTASPPRGRCSSWRPRFISRTRWWRWPSISPSSAALDLGSARDPPAARPGRPRPGGRADAAGARGAAQGVWGFSFGGWRSSKVGRDPRRCSDAVDMLYMLPVSKLRCPRRSDAQPGRGRALDPAAARAALGLEGV